MTIEKLQEIIVNLIAENMQLKKEITELKTTLKSENAIFDLFFNNSKISINEHEIDNKIGEILYEYV